MGFFADNAGGGGESPKLSFTQLNNIRKNLNAYTKRLIESRPSFQNTLSLKVQAQLRGAIDEAIKDIFRQNPTAFSKASELYTTALKDYAQMKSYLSSLLPLAFALSKNIKASSRLSVKTQTNSILFLRYVKKSLSLYSFAKFANHFSIVWFFPLCRFH